MKDNPYQSPAISSFAPIAGSAASPIRPIPALMKGAMLLGFVLLTGISCVFLTAIGGIGGMLAGLVAWGVLFVCHANARSQRTDRVIYLVVFGGGVIIVVLGTTFLAPIQVTLGCLVLAVGLGLLRIWFRSADERNLVGLAMLNQGKYERAIAEFDRALRRNPAHCNALLNRGVAAANLERWDQAQSDLDEAVRLRPDWQLAYAHRGQLMIRRKAWDEAIVDLQVALEKSPDDAESRFWLAMAFRGRKDLDRAKAELELLFPVISYRLNAQLHRATILVEQGDHAAAVADLEAVIALDPTLPDPWITIGTLSAASPNPAVRDAQRAIMAGTRACKLCQWQNWKAASALAAGHAEAGQFDEAVRWAREALRLAPPEEKTTRQQRLEQFQAGQPYRIPPVERQEN